MSQQIATASPLVRTKKSLNISVIVPVVDSKEIRNLLIRDKKVAIYVIRDYENHVDKEIEVMFFVAAGNEGAFYEAIQEWSDSKGYGRVNP